MRQDSQRQLDVLQPDQPWPATLHIKPAMKFARIVLCAKAENVKQVSKVWKPQ